MKSATKEEYEIIFRGVSSVVSELETEVDNQRQVARRLEYRIHEAGVDLEQSRKAVEAKWYTLKELENQLDVEKKQLAEMLIQLSAARAVLIQMEQPDDEEV